MGECKNCIHQRICEIWRSQERQNASCYVDDCFEPKNKWIKASEHKPKHLQEVLVYFKDGQVSILHYHSSFTWWESDVMYWIPRPEPLTE